MKTEDERAAAALIAELLSRKADEAREDEIFAEMDKICPDPEWSDHIFHSSNAFLLEDGTFDVEAVVKKIFSYKPIIL